MTESVHRVLAALRQDGASQVALVHGDLVLAEPAALEVAEAVAARHGGRVEPHRRPPGLGPLLQDLRTFSMFGSAKVLLAIDTFAFADRSAAADLVAEAGEALPLAGGAGPPAALSVRERQAASRLLQALKLFEIEAADAAEPAERLPGRLSAWVFEGGKAARRARAGRARGKRQVEELREGLAALLDAAGRGGGAGGGGGG